MIIFLILDAFNFLKVKLESYYDNPYTYLYIYFNYLFLIIIINYYKFINIKNI